NSTFEEQGPWLGDAGRQLIVGTLFDISSRKEIEQQLLRMVITDPFASRLREHVRATDMAARIGGRNSLCCWKRHR
ncbi:TPA: sensor domain-containing diguanylate cyclase, partial [Klebsiella pneumoniae]|nr:sensor domain-containing diguanylate cyclase [Klebsiella pneumoniae]